MLGRTPDDIKAIRPLKDGVIADFTATQLLLKNLLKKVCIRYNAGKPRVVVGVPSGITEVEERAVEESIIQAGAKEVYLIEEPMAAAIGSNSNVAEPTGNIIVDIGGGTREVAVISLGGIVLCNSLRVAGDELDEDIINYVKKELNLAIGETTAEQIKIEVGCALPPMTELSMEIRGRDLITGLPKHMTITSSQVGEAMAESIREIVESVKQTLEKTPPELASDIIETYALIESSRKRCADNYLKMKEILDSAVKDVDLPIDNVESNLADDLATINSELAVVEDTDELILRFIKAIDDDRFRKLLDKDLNSTIY